MANQRKTIDLSVFQGEARRVRVVIKTPVLGELTTRTNSSNCVITYESGSIIPTVGESYELRWSGGRRQRMTAASATGQAVTFTGGTGSPLPATGESISITGFTEPKNIAGWDAQCLVRTKQGTVVGTFEVGASEDADGGPITITDASGLIDLVFNETWTAAADDGFLRYDLLVTPDDRRPFFPFGGNLHLQARGNSSPAFDSDAEVTVNLDQDVVIEFAEGLPGESGTGGGGGGSGTVTSITLTQPAAGLTITGSGTAITTSGTRTFALANDLAALEALSGTNTIYYRSASDTWTAVTIGSSLSFTGGTLDLGSTPALGTPVSGNFSTGTFTWPTFNQNTTGSAATLTTGRTIGITGDITYTSPAFNGASNVTAAATLATVNSNVGQFGSTTDVARVTVNAKGLVTAVDTVTITPAVTSITGFGTDVLAALQIQLDTSGGLTSKTYVDSLSAGLKWKAPVRVATTTNGTISTAFANGQTVDGVTLATGDRILLKDQSTGSQNGIYVVAASGSPTRATDADANSELPNAAVFVAEGTTNADKAFVCTNNSVTIGSTSITWVNFAASTGALLATNNLSDVASASTARTNIGLGASDTPTFIGTKLTGGTLGSVTITGDSSLGFGEDYTLSVYLQANRTMSLGGNLTTNAAVTINSFWAGLLDDTSAIESLNQLHTQGANIASASTVNLSTATGWAVTITGTTTITAFTSQTAGNAYLLTFSGALTLTHNATSLICPGGASITTAAGDTAIVASLGSGNWKVHSYTRADGTPLALPSSAVTLTGTQTLTNKRITRRVNPTNAPGATPTANTDNYDVHVFTGLNAAITSMTTNLSGTPTAEQMLLFAFTDDGTGRAITWGTSFEASGNVALPTTTVAGVKLHVGFFWNSVTSKWRCVAVS